MVKTVSKSGPSPKVPKRKKTPILKRKLFTYSPSKVKCALSQISEGMSISKASRLYGVPRATLWNKVNGRAPETSGHVGFVSVLPLEIENQLEKWVLEMADKGFPITCEMLVDSVEQLVKAKSLATPFSNNRPGRKWIEAFLRRHPTISKKQAEGLTTSRANVSEEIIRTWFCEVETSLKSDYGLATCKEIFNDPKRIFNIDETALFLSPKGGTILGRRGHSTFNVSKNNEKSCITTTICVNAQGDVINPCIIFPYKRLPAAIQRNAPPNWGLGITDNGWMTGEAFFEFISNVFCKHLTEKNVPLPVLIFLDGHTSHITIHLHEFCVKNKIILVALPPNATHLMQPLDVAVFRPLKVRWKKVVRDWKIQKGTEVTKENFCLVLKEALFTAELQKSIVSGFKTTGLYPFDQNEVKYGKLVKRQPQPSHQHTAKQEQSMNYLEHLESKISEDLLIKFHETLLKKCGWEGPKEASLLFNVWKEIKEEDDQKNESLIEINDEISQDDNALTECLNQDLLVSGIDFNQEDEYDVDDPQPIICEGENFETMFFSNNEEKANCSEFSTMIKEAEIIFADEFQDEFADAASSFAVEDDLQENEPSRELQENKKKAESLTTVSPLKELDLNVKDTKITPSTSTSTHIPQPCSSSGITCEKPSHVRNIFHDTHFWPGDKKSTTKRKPAVKMPSVITSQMWKTYFENKEQEKKMKEDEKIKKRVEREAKKISKSCKKKSKDDDDWICARCSQSYNEEKKMKIPKKWIECDNCKRTLHYKCIPKVYLESWDITEEMLDKKTIDFQCHICIEEDDTLDLT